MMKKILSIQLLKIFLIKNTEEDIFNKIQKKVLLMKNLSDAELKIIFNTRVIPNWNTYEDLTTMALCVEAKAHLNSKFVWLVRMREHFTHLIKRFKKRAIEEGRLLFQHEKKHLN
jgi:hypothetical protein